MKTQNIFIKVLNPRPKSQASVSLTKLYITEALGLVALAAIWNSSNPLIAIIAYLIGTRVIQYVLRRNFAVEDLRKYRTLLDGIAGLEIIILSLVYVLNNFERIGRLINPGFAPDETSILFSLIVLLGLATALTVYLALRVYVGLKKPRSTHNPWSTDWFDSVIHIFSVFKNLAIKLVEPLLDFRLRSYSKLSLKERVYIVIRGLIFPVGVLAPFLLTRFESQYCPLKGACLSTHGSGVVQNVAVLVFLIIIIIVSLLRDRPRNHAALRRFVCWQFVISAAVFVVTIAAYTIMYRFSQGAGNEIIMVTNNDVTIQNKALFGLGLPRGMVFGLGAIYLFLPVFRWYRVLFSHKYIDGIKKQELFQ